MSRIAYSLFVRTPQGGAYKDEIYADPRGAGNAAIMEFATNQNATAIIITRIAVTDQAREQQAIDIAASNGDPKEAFNVS